jgi:hypothetical protein
MSWSLPPSMSVERAAGSPHVSGRWVGKSLTGAAMRLDLNGGLARSIEPQE